MKLLIAVRESRYMQYLSAIIATLSTASAAMHLTWPSPTLPKLASSNSPIGAPITGEEGSWIAAGLRLGAIAGCAMGAWFVERFGRKNSLLLSTIPLTLPWIVITFTKSVLVICVARFVAGIAWGLIITAASIYNGEIAEEDIRGKLGTTFNILKLVGTLYVLSVGPFVSYIALTLSCAVLPILFAALFYLMPESPYYLVKVGQVDAARKSIIRLSSSSAGSSFIENRLKEIQTTVDNDMKNRCTLWEMLTNSEYRNSLIVVAGIKSLQLLSGVTAIESYMQTIIEASDSSVSPEVASIIAGVVQIPAALLAAALVDRMGRKPLMIISAIGCGIALIGEGVYFYLQDVVHADVSCISWLPATGLWLYLVMNPLGIFTLPWILLGELFATNIKGIAISFFTVYGGILAFFVTKFFQPISDQWGMHVTFWIFAFICLAGAAFVYFVQPETKGKTFAEIQAELNRNRRKHVDNEKNLSL